MFSGFLTHRSYPSTYSLDGSGQYAPPPLKVRVTAAGPELATLPGKKNEKNSAESGVDPENITQK